MTVTSGKQKLNDFRCKNIIRKYTGKPKSVFSFRICLPFKSMKAEDSNSNYCVTLHAQSRAELQHHPAGRSEGTSEDHGAQLSPQAGSTAAPQHCTAPVCTERLSAIRPCLCKYCLKAFSTSGDRAGPTSCLWQEEQEVKRDLYSKSHKSLNWRPHCYSSSEFPVLRSELSRAALRRKNKLTPSSNVHLLLTSCSLWLNISWWISMILCLMFSISVIS